MSKHKPTATAVIRFFADKSVTVALTSLVGVSPRRLERASHLLMREYRGKRAAHNAKRHRMDREKVKQDAADLAEADTAFHEAEDKRLAKAAEEDEKAGKEALKVALEQQEEEKNKEGEE